MGHPQKLRYGPRLECVGHPTIMNILRFKPVIFTLLLVLLPRETAVSASQTSKKDGTLIVQVTWEDIDNTPANDVYVEAYGFVSEVRLSKSFVLKMQNKGQYQASLPAGVYDVFVSEGGSVPRCRRVLIKP